MTELSGCCFAGFLGGGAAFEGVGFETPEVAGDFKVLLSVL